MTQHQTEQNTRRRKLVIIGDGACGKTSLLSAFAIGYFPAHYVPTIFDNYITDCRVDGRSVRLSLWYTAGQEDFEWLRPLTYPKSHVVLIGFSVDRPDSLENVQQKWIEEARERCSEAAIFVVGLKIDLREDPMAIEEMRKKDVHFTTRREGLDMAQDCRAKKYSERSSLTGEEWMKSMKPPPGQPL